MRVAMLLLLLGGACDDFHRPPEGRPGSEGWALPPVPEPAAVQSTAPPVDLSAPLAAQKRETPAQERRRVRAEIKQANEEARRQRQAAKDYERDHADDVEVEQARARAAQFPARMERCCNAPAFAHSAETKALCISWGLDKCVK